MQDLRTSALGAEHVLKLAATALPVIETALSGVRSDGVPGLGEKIDRATQLAVELRTALDDAAELLNQAGLGE